jgi:hypothetical protein
MVAIKHLESKYNKYFPSFPQLTGGGVKSAHQLGIFAPLSIPLIFLLGWLILWFPPA